MHRIDGTLGKKRFGVSGADVGIDVYKRQTHNSSAAFSTEVGSALHEILLSLQPDVYKRQGQNLPDKEFRSLRTVIVTAAVHWGFNSMLAHLLLTFQHRAGVSSYTSSFDLAQKMCIRDSPRG